ncbi:MAG: hypothetical protein IJO14_05660, partial [Clostridia bacterium]|nr:hypothetical protein [Clostridia bacterium]
AEPIVARRNGRNPFPYKSAGKLLRKPSPGVFLSAKHYFNLPDKPQFIVSVFPVFVKHKKKEPLRLPFHLLYFMLWTT